jgi:photosystem II stability/assembly factor-like uncharacterized protein
MKIYYILIVNLLLLLSITKTYSNDLKQWKVTFDSKLFFGSSNQLEWELFVSELLKYDSLNFIVYGNAGDRYNKILKTTDGGLNWKVILNTHNDKYFSSINSVSFLNRDSILLTSSYHKDTVYRTTNGGLIWDIIDTKLKCSFYYRELSFIKNGTGIGYARDQKDSTNLIVKTTDFGLSWEKQLIFPEFDNIKLIQLISENSITCWAYNDSSPKNYFFCRTDDFGKTWFVLPMVNNEQPLVSKFFDSLTCLVGCVHLFDSIAPSYTVILKTNDGGITWQRIIPPQIIRGFFDLDMLDSNNLLFCSPFGNIIKTTDGGKNWICDSTAFNINGTQFVLGEYGKFVTPKRVIVCITFVSKIYLWDEDGFPSDVEEHTEQNSQLSISPNPANDYCNIKINIHEPCLLRLELLNTFGQSMLPAITEFSEAGQYSKQLDLSGLAPGLYFVVVNIGKERLVQKFVKME